MPIRFRLGIGRRSWTAAPSIGSREPRVAVVEVRMRFGRELTIAAD
jgi:hypothetical protein